MLPTNQGELSKDLGPKALDLCIELDRADLSNCEGR